MIRLNFKGPENFMRFISKNRFKFLHKLFDSIVKSLSLSSPFTDPSVTVPKAPIIIIIIIRVSPCTPVLIYCIRLLCD